MIATAVRTLPAVNLKSLLAPIAAELATVEQKLRATDDDEFPLLHLALDRVFGSGGKRLRPALAILAAQAGPQPVEARRIVALGAAMETLHTASLVHDDLIDNAPVRRGVETLNAWMSPAATVLAGDYLFARAAVLITETEHIGVIARFADSLRQLCDGELRQMFRNAFVNLPGLARSLGLDTGGADMKAPSAATATVEDTLALLPSDEDYERRITGKTAALFATSAQTGAMLAVAGESDVNALRRYGLCLGRAFQVVDDVLDFTSTEAELGKPVGSDLRGGHLTLPVMRFAQAHPQEWHGWVQRIPQLVKGSEWVFGTATDGSGKRSSTTEQEQAVNELIDRVASSEGVPLALARAADYAREAQAALTALPPSPARTVLHNLAEYVVERSY
ncbi:MAG: polyprenyl synthetase family protein [Chloroflexota bacterium]|nr:polyprenyl synthetase family protein [Chloroflexota bacterium]